jgi:hypothetical protein
MRHDATSNSNSSSNSNSNSSSSSSSGNHGALALSQVCLVAAIGLLSGPQRSSDAMAYLLYEQAQAVLGDVVASPYAQSVQVLLLHCIYLEHCGKTGAAWTVCGMALRIAQSLGLHRRATLFSPDQSRWRARLWWVAFSLDAFLSLSEGRPPASGCCQNDADIDDLSDAECAAAATASLLDAPANHIYQWHVRLALVANRLVAVLCERGTRTSIFQTLDEMDRDLVLWRDSIPMEFRPEQEILASKHMYPYVAWLHIQYFNLMRAVHWTSVSLPKAGAGDDDDGVLQGFLRSARIRSSDTILVSAAQSLIRTLNHLCSAYAHGLPPLLSFPLSNSTTAAAVVFRHIIRYPDRLSARTDLEYLRTGILHVSHVLDSSPTVVHFRDLFGDMERLAEAAVVESKLVAI